MKKAQGSIAKIFMVTLFAVVCLVTTGCSTASPNAGYEGVLIEKPYLFGHGGIDPEPVKTGLTFIAPTTDVVYVSIQPIQAHLKLDDIMTSDGVPLDFDAVIRVQVTDSVDLIKRFGGGWYENNIEREFANRIRTAVKKHGMNETAISTTAVDEIDREVSDGMTKYLKSINMPVRLIQVTVGKANPPDSIKNQRIETASQQQRVLTEGQRKLAEDSRKAAELSRAEADNAYRNAMTLSAEQYLQLEAIKAQERICTSGAKCTFISNGGKATPILDGR